MEMIIWILKGIIALIFTYTGISKMILPKTNLLRKGMRGLINLNDRQIKAAGLLEVIGALGLLLPSILNVYPFLSVIAAICLGLTMIAAGWINYKLKLSIALNFVIFFVCTLIAFWQL